MSSEKFPIFNGVADELRPWISSMEVGTIKHNSGMFGALRRTSIAYDPTGDNKVMGHWADLFGPDSDGLSTGLPIPSRELSVWTRAKACGLNALRAKETA
ncbi:hypothetical protein F2Q70_00038128 [Brassica cretica]|uniref:Uncharacterized protein n=2 Tax=Brassica cretica TaxID=69181 RepID=A0A3N6RIC3_BRACR|nr:hypothetical protein F2Q70_00038128 [Brassica cretica]KAF2618886.1 hypothetical protein F2Q68_00038535 [Brassica cretica]KAF3494808.1 hypothetical protein DY000_02052144 [Brassica cretica]KAF3574534.1 hypothetical protein F2Q69_00058362 [Brassica cretica]